MVQSTRSVSPTFEPLATVNNQFDPHTIVKFVVTWWCAFQVPFVLSLQESPEAIAAIKKTALAVSNPDSSLYGQFLSSAEIAALTQPAAADLEAVTSWLANAGVAFNVEGSRVVCSATLAQAEGLFAPQFSTLVHRTSDMAVLRAGAYWLPDHIEARVAAVFGLHGLPVPRAGPPPMPAQPANVTPAVITSTYKVSGVKPKAAGNLQAVAEFQGQYMSDKDLAQFFKNYVPRYTVGDQCRQVRGRSGQAGGADRGIPGHPVHHGHGAWA